MSFICPRYSTNMASDTMGEATLDVPGTKPFWFRFLRQIICGLFEGNLLKLKRRVNLKNVLTENQYGEAVWVLLWVQ